MSSSFNVIGVLHFLTVKSFMVKLSIYIQNPRQLALTGVLFVLD